MKALNVEAGGVTSEAGRARDSTARLLCICALNLVMCASLSALVNAQAATASRTAGAIPNQSNHMTELTTVDVPLETPAARTATEETAIRPFRVKVSDAALTDLRRRIKATRWPDQETVADQSQGAQLAKLQPLVQYWGNGYDWRKAEAKLNALPQFTTNIDGLDIHFIQVKSKERNALPVLITHGWPGSVFEFLGTIGPLTDPVAHGGTAADAFDVVIPSIPGYGFSGRPTAPGWGPERVAQVWAELMKRLGYTRYVAQGGDWGAVITTELARQAPPGLLGIHLNLPAAVPPDVGAALATGAPAPAGLSDQERTAFESSRKYAMSGASAYFVMLTARPQAVGYSLNDSPAGLAAFMLVHPGFAKWTYGADPAKAPTKDQVLDDFTLYWLTNTSTSAGRLYWENKGRGPTSSAVWKTTELSLPVAVTNFQEDAYQPPESWVRRAYKNLIYFHEVPKGGHFAAWEQPQLFTTELRAAFKSLR
jgi:pimeloyl-ACP methyl ester carboxylesterase